MFNFQVFQGQKTSPSPPSPPPNFTNDISMFVPQPPTGQKMLTGAKSLVFTKEPEGIFLPND